MRHMWTEEEIEFVRELYPDYPNQEIVEMLKDKFGIVTNRRNLENLRAKYKFPKKKINIGCFQKGMTPHNKGKRVSKATREKMLKSNTWFEKGQDAWNIKPVGSERVDIEGYTSIKVADPDVWKLKHRVLWEEHHGRKLEDGEIVVFLDGDKSNLEIDNLRVMHRKHSAALSKKQRWVVGAPEILDSSINLTELEVKVLDLKREQRRERTYDQR